MTMTAAASPRIGIAPSLEMRSSASGMRLFPDDIFNIADIVLDVARTDPNRIAVIEPDGVESSGKRKYKRYTYAQLSADIESVAPGLREIGVAEGTRIVCMTPPSYETAVLDFALQRVGATTMWIDPGVGYVKVGERLRSVSPEAFAGPALAHLGRMTFGWGPRFLKKAIVVGQPPLPGAYSLASLKRTAPSSPPKPKVTPDDPTVILFTTGSTGPAKPAYYPHRSFTALCRIVHESWRFEPGKPPVDISLFPAFFFIPITAGGTLVVPPINFARESPAKANPKAILEVINDCGVESAFASPVLLENIANYAIEHGIKTPTFRRAIGGGAPIIKRVKERLLAMMGPDGAAFSNYGASEAMPSTEMDGRETVSETWERTENGEGLCIGRPFTGVEIKIVRMSDGVVEKLSDTDEMPNGEIGEILVRGPHVSPRYYLDDASTRKNKIYGPNGEIWHRLGDAGHLDEKGRVWYCGRVSQRVKAKEAPLFSLNCEPIFDSHPAVRRSGLVGVPNGDGTDLPVICVELEPTTPSSQVDAIRTELLALAGKHRTTTPIKHVLFPKALPVDPRHNSKIERPALARWATENLVR